MNIKTKIIFSAFLTLLATQTSYPGSSMSSLSEEEAKQEEQTEKFNFEELIVPQKNQIIEFAWSSHDNTTNFERKLLEWTNIDSITQNDTSILERNRYGFNGKKLPIYFLTLKNGLPTILQVGNVLQEAQPSLAGGFWYADSHVPSTELFLDGPNEKPISVTLEDSNAPHLVQPKITAACFSVLGKLAIAWENNSNEQFITFLHLVDIKQNKKIDLSQNAIPLKPIVSKILRGKLSTPNVIKGSLFRLDGSKLGICSMEMINPQTSYWSSQGLNHIANADHSVQYLDVNPSLPLTTDEKAKRLGVATAGAKLLLEKNQKMVN